MTDLVLVKSAEYNGIRLDCYVERGQECSEDFWATREQIGRLLEYENPDISIANIHNRNKARLDNFSTLTKLIRVEGNREVFREVTVYSFKGLLEICRYSNQPKANNVMDWLWNVADEIRRNGTFSLHKENPALPSGVLDGAKLIFEVAGIKDNQLALALDRVYSSYTGKSALAAGNISLKAPTPHQTLTPSEIGAYFGIKAHRVNEILAGAGYQHKISGRWEALEPGERFAVMVDVGKRHGNGTAIRQLRWDSAILDDFKNFI